MISKFISSYVFRVLACDTLEEKAPEKLLTTAEVFIDADDILS